jgi:pilus assembly protein CpaE
VESTPIYVAGLEPDAEKALLGSLEDLQLARTSGTPGRDGASLAVVSVERDQEAGFALVSSLSAAGTRVAVVGPAKDPDLILRAMRAGAREFVVCGDPERLEVAVRNLARPLTSANAGGILAFFSAKGGMGSTSLAANVAGALAARGDRVCLVDLDVELGDVQSSLDIQGGYSIADVIANLRRLDRDLLDSSVTRHRSGVSVLSYGEHPEESERIEPESLGKLFAFLRRQYEHVVLDGVHGFDERSLAALDASDRVVLVVTQEVLSVRSAQRCVAIFRKLGYGDDKLRVVVNRHQKNANITKDVIAQTIGVPAAATVANDFQAFVRAVNRGGMLLEEARRPQVARDVAALADLLAPAAAPAQKVGILGRWFGSRVANGSR